MAGRATSQTVIGRERELAALGAAVESAKAGEPRIVLVAGDARIGKTRLVIEACARAEQLGVLCAVGGCVQLGESSLAFAPLVQALRGVRRRLCVEEFAELRGPAVPSVGAVLGITEVGSDGQHGQMFEQPLGCWRGWPIGSRQSLRALNSRFSGVRELPPFDAQVRR